jgi:hypothetical protein
MNRLLNMWLQQPALRYGSTLYNAVPCDSQQVFAVLRVLGEDRLLGLLNVGPHRQTVALSLPVDTLALAEGDYALHDLLEGGLRSEEQERSWRRDQLLVLKLTLEPFGAYCFAVRPVEQNAEILNGEAPNASQQPVAHNGKAHKNGLKERAVAEETPTAEAKPGSRARRRRAVAH